MAVPRSSWQSGGACSPVHSSSPKRPAGKSLGASLAVWPLPRRQWISRPPGQFSTGSLCPRASGK
eukprot:7058961-Alexandrium_andersonii.AAC.1